LVEKGGGVGPVNERKRMCFVWSEKRYESWEMGYSREEIL